jgi:hypothetical protein
MFNNNATPEMQYIGETKFVRSIHRLKQETDAVPEIAAGIVGFVDLILGAVLNTASKVYCLDD